MKPIAIILVAFSLSACSDAATRSQGLETASSELPALPLGENANAVVEGFDTGMAEIRTSLSAQNALNLDDALQARAGAAQDARELADRPTSLSSYEALQAQRHMADEIRKLDTENALFLERSLPAEGWFDSATHGEPTARSAFLIIQHSSDLRLMRLALARMEGRNPEASGDRRRMALLSDRIAVAEHRPQSFGTQIVCEAGRMEMYDLEHPETVDDRRRGMGFTDTLAEYTGKIPNFEKSCF